MSHTSMILSGILLLLMTLLVAPNIFLMNRGKVLRNVAIWLAIFVGLALFYQTFGPESPAPLFRLPYSMSGMNPREAPKIVPDSKGDKSNGATPEKEQPQSPSI